MKTYILYIIALITVFNFGFSSHSFAQKKARKTVTKPVPQEDYSKYIEGPICRVMILDSIVVPIHEVTKNIPMPAHMGRFFVSTEHDGTTVYENEFADTRMYSMADSSGHHNVYRQMLLHNKWAEPELVNINGDFIDIINPFPMPDGQTLYFAGRSQDDNEGKTISLYTTTYDSQTGTYLTPQCLPFPFTSNDNDLYFIDDGIDGVSWFATTRNQPEGMACIYTMQSKQPWVYYDSEEMEPKQLKSYALIERISDTWTSPSERQQVLDAINNTLSEYKKISSTSNVEHSGIKYLRNKIATLERQLDEYRLLYHKSNNNNSRLQETIKSTESQLHKLYDEYHRL